MALVVVSCICDGSADEVKLMRPGSTMVETYALVNSTQRNNIVCYLSNLEKSKQVGTLVFYHSSGKGDGDMKKVIKGC